MKISSAAIFFFVIITLSSVSGLSGWIPEHRCLDKSYSEKCDLYECMQKCSGKPFGVGRCRWNYCICTYYCHDPPK
ncbi:hypothetical protein BUALT_Bualt16G0127200 [Buddleja alternifolia]|uniref:Uncharacterized protein n=1 Tax=Buddleja alternifolia TaxID=168488 RepID=A0AAV6WHR5_9LAMI|nr:hypothetical protein BUALT_Bualt16G0127200 [Buddleja alternifolia]